MTRKFSRDTRHARPRHSPLAPLSLRVSIRTVLTQDVDYDPVQIRETPARFTSHMPRHSPTATKFSLPAFSGKMIFNHMPGVFR